MGGNIGGHSHCDAGGPVYQQRRQLGREHRRLVQRFIVVRDKIDRFFVQIGQHLMREPHHPDFRISHGRRRITVYGTEVSLSVNHRISQREILSHPYNGVIHR